MNMGSCCCGSLPCGNVIVSLLNCLGTKTENGVTITLKLGSTLIGTQATGNGVGGIARTATGSGYTSAPTVAISGGGGTGATAIAILSGTGVGYFVITAQGAGYTSTPTVTISGGGGTGATHGTITLLGGGQALFPITPQPMNMVGSITKTSAGSGYTSAPTVLISGGGGTGAAATVTISGGGLNQFTVTNPGTGYTSRPDGHAERWRRCRKRRWDGEPGNGLHSHGHVRVSVMVGNTVTALYPGHKLSDGCDGRLRAPTGVWLCMSMREL